MANSTRLHKVADMLQKTLVTLMQREIDDPRLATLNVNSVEMSRDLSYARVYVSSYDPNANKEDVVKALKKAKGFLRHSLAKTCDLRYVPDLRFVYDETSEKGSYLSSLIDKAIAGEG